LVDRHLSHTSSRMRSIWKHTWTPTIQRYVCPHSSCKRPFSRKAWPSASPDSCTSRPSISLVSVFRIHPGSQSLASGVTAGGRVWCDKCGYDWLISFVLILFVFVITGYQIVTSRTNKNSFHTYGDSSCHRALSPCAWGSSVRWILQEEKKRFLFVIDVDRNSQGVQRGRRETMRRVLRMAAFAATPPDYKLAAAIYTRSTVRTTRDTPHLDDKGPFDQAWYDCTSFAITYRVSRWDWRFLTEVWHLVLGHPTSVKKTPEYIHISRLTTRRSHRA